MAAIDSALNQGLVTFGDLNALFRAVPARFASVRLDLDGRAMSGIESITRLLAKDAGLRYELQVRFPGIGIVDLLIEDCIVIETDGRLNHEGEQHTGRDYDRDAALVSLGYIVLRFNYRQVMFQPDFVLETILAALRTHRGLAAR